MEIKNLNVDFHFLKNMYLWEKLIWLAVFTKYQSSFQIPYKTTKKLSHFKVKQEKVIEYL